MFKFFGLWGDDSAHADNHSHSSHGHEVHHGHDSHAEDGDSHNVSVHHTDDENNFDVGQVALDILDTESAIILVAPLAGVDISEVDISVSRNILTISGERQRPASYEESLNILVSECFFGPFSRSVILPENLAFNKISATMENNLLSIVVPKLTFPSKSIKINKLES